MKGRKVLALLLVMATVFTGIRWDFGKAEAAGENDATEVAADGKVTFDNMNVADLDSQGYTSTKFTDGKVVAGEINKAPSEHWFSGEGADTPYGTATNITGKNSGIKPNTAGNNDRYFMYTPYSYEDFKVSAEIYYGAYCGVVIGEKNVYPTKDGTSGSIAIFFNGGRIHIMGAVAYSTAAITRGSKAAKSRNENNKGYAIFNTGYGDTIANNAGTAYTMNVMKQGNHLSVWISGQEGVMTIDITDAYKTGWVGLQARGYHGDSGGFKSLEVTKIHAVESEDFEAVTLQDLDDAGYTARTSYNGGTFENVLDSTASAWFSGETYPKDVTYPNAGIKTTATSGYTTLNIPYVYKNFRLKVTMYKGQVAGVTIGKKTSTPRSAPAGAISVFVNGKFLQIEGAVQFGTAEATNGASGTNTTATNLCQLVPQGSSTSVTGQEITIVVELKDSTLSVWQEGHDGRVSMQVDDDYTTENIALFQRQYTENGANAGGGGFKSYEICNLDAGDAQDFDNVTLSNLDAAGYTATKYRSKDGTVTGAEGTTSTYWFSGDSGYTVTTSYKNAGLKPNMTGTDNLTTLNIPCAYDNFRLKTTVYKGQVIGVVIGKKGVAPSTTTATKDEISVYVNGKYLEIRGKIQPDSATVEGGSGSKGSGFYQLVPKNNGAEEWGQERTIVVEVQNGILSVWQEGYEGIVRLKVSEGFTTENIALFQRRYDDNGGGFKSYEIEKLSAKPNIGTTADLEGYTSFDQIDLAKLKEKGFTAARYDTEADTTTEGELSSIWFAGKIGASSAKVAVTSNDGLKPTAVQAEYKRAILNTPYTYQDFRISAEVYWGAGVGILLGEKNAYPSDTTASAVMIYFNAEQIQLYGAGIDPDTAVVNGADSWKTGYAPTYIFKPASDYKKETGKVYKLNVEMKDGTLTVWVDGYDRVLSVKTSETFKNESIALMARNYDSDGGGIKSLTVEELAGDIVMPYTAENFADYRQEGNYTSPVYKNYLFAGWYTDAECTLENAVSASVATVDTDIVYAKFVPRYILTVKAQISANLLDDDRTNDEKGNIRFATTVDTLQYTEVGFRISWQKDGNTVTKISASNTVYETLNAIGGITYQPTRFCNASAYFKACTIKNIGADYYGLEFTVVPFWKTLDGTMVDGDTVKKTINQGLDLESTVYVSDNGTDQTGYGTIAAPYKTLNYAIDAVADGGTVCITDTCTVDNDNTWESHNKTVTITGTKENAASVLQGAANLPRFCIGDGATFKNLTFQLLSTTANSVHAEGNPVTIERDVVVLGVKEIYGGSRFNDVASTNLKLYAGTYEKIFGGSYEKKVTGDTRVTVGGNVNKDVDTTSSWSDHAHVYKLYGAGDQGSVEGNTYVTVEEGAKFIYIYGGGRSTSSNVSGSTNVNFSGKAMSIYGGGYHGTNADANVVIQGGNVQQIFGGCEDASMTGNVKIQVLGGTVDRRIYGGCYNDYKTSGWVADVNQKALYSVQGNISVEIGAGCNLALATDTDNGVNAVSRYKSAIEGECGILIFNGDTYETWENKIGSNFFTNAQQYNYLVKVTKHGNVSLNKNGSLCVIPEEGYTARVCGADNSEISAGTDGAYILPTLEESSSKQTITVTFSKSE